MSNFLASITSNKLLKSWVKVFAAALLTAFLADTTDVFSVDFSDIKVYIAAGVAAVGPLVVTWLDPTDDRAGRFKAQNK